MEVDFIDINMGCPIDLVYKKGQGSALMNRTNKLEQVRYILKVIVIPGVLTQRRFVIFGNPSQIVRSMKRVLSAGDDYVPLSIKFRTGIQEGINTAHTLIPKLKVCLNSFWLNAGLVNY